MSSSHGRICALIVVTFSLRTANLLAQCPTLRNYTDNGDFDEVGTTTKVNVDHPVAGRLELNAPKELYPYINVACSTRGTMVRIDVNTRAVLGEYWTAPDNRARNPSRTTV